MSQQVRDTICLIWKELVNILAVKNANQFYGVFFFEQSYAIFADPDPERIIVSFHFAEILNLIQ